MFQYLRSHRRTGSTPNSPQPSQWSNASPQLEDDASPAFSPHSAQDSHESPAVESPISPLPPVLPPIPRIASRVEHEKKRPASQYTASSHRGEGNTIPRLSIPQPPRPRPYSQTPSNDLPDLPDTIPRVASRYESNYISTWHHRETKSAGGVEENAQRLTAFRRSVRPEASTSDQKSAPVRMDDESEFGMSARTTPQLKSNDPSQRPTTPSTSTAQQHTLSVPNVTNRPISPASSLSSMQRTPSSTNIQLEHSPASSKSTQPPQQIAPPQKLPTKSKSKLLNPVTSFLKRRKTSQGSENISEHDLMPRNPDIPAVGLPDDWDPRIRGKGVHDFSAPRPGRNLSVGTAKGHDPIFSNREGAWQQLQQQQRLNRHDVSRKPLPSAMEKEKTPEREHAAVFTENFDDNEHRYDEHAVTRESLANPRFLARMSRQLDFNANDAVDGQERATATAHHESSGKNMDNRTSSDQSTIWSTASNETKATSPPQSPPNRLSRASLEPPFQPAGLPKHFKSSASQVSRFSFQIANDPSAVEEKALEEKHKEKSRASRASVATEERYPDSDEDDPSMYDDMYDYEEPIPGVNVDDEETEDHFGLDATQSETMISKQSFNQKHGESLSPEAQDSPAAKALISGLGLGQLQNLSQPNEMSRQSSSAPVRSGTQYSGLSESMYFDDGMIDSPGDEGYNAVDESMFDNPSKQDFDKPNTSHFSSSLLDEVNRQSEDLPASRSDYGDNNEELTYTNHGIDNEQPELPTHISAYHNALATAANRAAADGKFNRQNSISDYGDEAGFPDAMHDIGNTDWGDGNFTDDDIAIEDDPMIAAANAEALAADEYGFYGQEFGFYGSSHAKNDEFYSGGYFGNPLVQAAMISREPNLTPITERSEFSTRNSFVSVGQFGPPGSSHGIPLGASAPREPGLKELAASMSHDDDDMTLSQLLRLRKETFGYGHSHSNSLGSNGSNHSSPNASLSGPFSARSPNPLAPTQEESSDDQQGNSSFDEAEEFEDGYDSPSSPTVTMADPVRLSAGSAQEIYAGSANYSNFANYWNSYDMPPPPKPYVNAVSSAHQHQAIPRPADHDTALPLTGQQEQPRTSMRASGSSSSNAFPVAAPRSPPPILSNPVPGPNQAPMPSGSVLNKLNARPQPAAYSAFHKRASSHGEKEKSSPSSGDRDRDRDSVAYVRGDESEGGRWYLERRRTMDTGEVVVVGRELVEGGRI